MGGKAKLQPGKDAVSALRIPAPHHSHTPGLNPKTACTPARKGFAALAIAFVLFCHAVPAGAAAGHAGAAAGEQTIITFRKEALLAGPNIALGQVADLVGPASEKLLPLDLGPVPWPGTQRLIDATVVKIKLFREGFELAAFAFAGDGCIVSVKTVTVPGQQIAEAARDLLLERLPWPEDAVEIEIESQPADQQIMAGSGAPALEATMTGSVAPGGKVRVGVTGSIDGCALFRTTVSFQVHVFHNVMVARRDVAQGEIFSEENITDRRLDVTTLAPGSLFSDAGALAGKKAARSIRAGMPITRQVVLVPPVVKRGGIVQIVYRTDFMALSARGVAQEDGVPGKLIRVRNIDSAREVVGEVLPSGQVSVKF